MQSGHLEVAKWLRENGCEFSDDTMELAVKGGNIEVCKWLLINGCKISKDTVPKSIRLLKLLLEWGYKPGPKFFSQSAEKGRFGLMKWAKCREFSWDETTCASAASAGRLDILQWARKFKCPWNETCCVGAARSGKLEILKWAREEQCPWNHHTISEAGLYGHFEVMKWAVENGCPLPDTVVFSTTIDKISNIDYLFQKGCLIREVAVREAVRKGQVQTLIWFLTHGAPHTISACNEAAKYGKLSMLQWLCSMKFAVSAATMQSSVRHPHIFKWLKNNGCPWNNETSTQIVRVQNAKLLKWALKRNCPVSKDICEIAAQIGDLEVMKVLMMFKCDFTLKATERIIKNGHYRLLSWLVKNGHVKLTKELYEIALRSRETLEWLEYHKCPTQ